VPVIRLELSHRNLDPLRRKKRGYNPVPGGEGFPSLPAVVEGRRLSMFDVIPHISAAMHGTVVVDVGVEAIN